MARLAEQVQHSEPLIRLQPKVHHVTWVQVAPSTRAPREAGSRVADGPRIEGFGDRARVPPLNVHLGSSGSLGNFQESLGIGKVDPFEINVPMPTPFGELGVGIPLVNGDFGGVVGAVIQVID